MLKQTKPTASILVTVALVFSTKYLRQAMPTLVFLCILSNIQMLHAQMRAIDASVIAAPVVTVSQDYARPEELNNTILPGCQVVAGVAGNDCLIQIKARVYRPQTLIGRYPLVVLLHGNHGTCGSGNPRVDNNIMFTTHGTCPDGQTVAQSFAGYAYLADQLASAGYVVVSIDANRGITGHRVAPPMIQNDRFLILARGRLVLSHLRLLSQCNQTGTSGLPPCDVLQNHLDFGNVGLMGHSRGGEGVRAAYNLYGHDPSNNWQTLIPDAVTFQGIFEIGPTDNMCKLTAEIEAALMVPLDPGCTDTDRANTFDALGTNWNVLLPMCDGDVDNLQGERPFDRMMLEFENPDSQKSTYLAWGTNHNFYNTQWQQNDGVCSGPGNVAVFTGPPGSLLQRLTSISSFLAFFRGNVGTGADATFNQNFNPLFDPPAQVQGLPYPTRVYRAYVPSAGLTSSTLFNDFDAANGFSSYNVPDNASPGLPAVNHVMLKNHDPAQRVGLLSWSGAGGQNLFYQMNWTQANKFGKDVSASKTLDFRISRQDDGTLNNTETANFSIRLVGANGVMTRPVPLNRYTDFRDTGGTQGPGGPRGPVGGASSGSAVVDAAFGSGLHPMLQTVRIPLTEFGNFDFIKQQVRGVRFVFDQNLVGGMATGAVYIGNVRFTNTLGSGVAAVAPFNPVSQLPGPGGPITPAPPVVHPGTIVSITFQASLPALGGQPGYEIQLHSAANFLATNNVAVLTIGVVGTSHVQQSILIRYPDPSDSTNVIFALTTSQFAATLPGDPVNMQAGVEIWQFGGRP